MAGGAGGIGAGGTAAMMTPFAGAGLTLGIGFGLSALGGQQNPQQVTNNLYALGNSAFTPGGLSGVNPLYGGFASIFGNVNSQASAQQAYQNLLSAENDPNKLAQLFPTMSYIGEPGTNNPILGAINSYAQQFVNSPSLWNTFSGVNPANVYQGYQNFMNTVGQGNGD